MRKRTLEGIIAQLSSIKGMGHVRSMRRGPTGIGFTLETLLGIRENNRGGPDLGEFEIKARREQHQGLTTLFTFNRNAWKMDPLDAIQTYGSQDKNGRLGLYYTMRLRPNSAGLFLLVEEEHVSVRSVDGTLIAQWALSDIENRFNGKVKNVLLVTAETEMRGGAEYFWFYRARWLSGGVTKSILRDQFRSEQLVLDLRLHDKGTSARNHGTGFRIQAHDLENFYQEVREVPI